MASGDVKPIYNYPGPHNSRAGRPAAWPDAARVSRTATSPQTPSISLCRPTPCYVATRTAASPRRRVTCGSCPGTATRRLIAGRQHPLGVVVESRGLGWNFPTGNEDIVYFIYTFYNVTSSDPADYAGGPAVHPADPDGAGPEVPRSGNNAAFRRQRCRRAATPSTACSPPSRRTWTWPRPAPNYCSVNLPFALGFCYEHMTSTPSAAGSSTRRSSGRRSSPARASWA